MPEERRLWARKTRLVELPARRTLRIANDAMCAFYSTPCGPLARPLDIFNSFMRGILATLTFNRFIEEYHLCFDIQKFMHQMKIEVQQKRSEGESARPYKDRPVSDFQFTDQFFLDKGKSVPFQLRGFLAERNLRPLFFQYLVKKAAEAMETIDGPTLVIHYDFRGPWILSSQNAYQDPSKLIKAGEGEILAWRALRGSKHALMESSDSDNLVFALIHHDQFETLLLSGSSKRFLNIKDMVSKLGAETAQKLIYHYILAGTDFVENVLPSRITAKKVWSILQLKPLPKTEGEFFLLIKRLFLERGAVPPSANVLSDHYSRINRNLDYWTGLQLD